MRIKVFTLATVILGATLFALAVGMSDAAAFGVVGGLSGAAYGALCSDLTCSRNHLQ